MQSFEAGVLAATFLGLAVCGAGSASGLTPIDRADLSPDITQTLDGQTVSDEDVAADDLMSGMITLASLGSLPAQSDVSAYHLLDDGDQLISFDVTVSLPGPLTAAPGDIVRYDGVSYSLEFDASAESVPDGVRADAVSLDPGGNLVLSFDTTVSLSGSTFDDEDLVEFDGATFTSYFDGSAEGVGAGLDVDAAHVFPSNGNLALSFDASGSIGGVSFDDEDVLEYDPVGLSWEMAWDASVERPEWNAGSDTNAVHLLPEPAGLAMLAFGCLLLGLLRARRSGAAVLSAALIVLGGGPRLPATVESRSTRAR